MLKKVLSSRWTLLLTIPVISSLAAGPVTFDIRDQEKARIFLSRQFPFDPRLAVQAYVTDYNLAKAPGTEGKRLALEFLNALYAKSPDFDPGSALRLANGVEALYQKRFGELRNQDFEGALADLQNLSGTALSVPSIKDVLKVGYHAWSRNEDILHRQLEYNGLAREALNYDPSLFDRRYHLMDSPGGLYEMFGTAAKNEKLAAVLDTYLAELNHHAQTADSAAIWKSFNRDADLALKVDDLGDKIDLGLLSAQNAVALINQQRLLVKQLEVRLGKTLPTDGAPSHSLTQEERDERMQSIRNEFLVPRGLLNLLAGVVAQKDPEARAFIVTAKLILDVAETKAMQAAGLMSAAAATGNVYAIAAAAVISLAEIFLFSGNEDLTASQIRSLREEIQNLHEEMRAQFRALNETLDEIYYRLDTQLYAIEERLENKLVDIQTLLNASLAASHRSQQTLDWLVSSQLRQTIGELRASEIENQKNYCLENEPGELSRTAYFQAMNRFYTCAENDALDSISAGGEIGAEPYANLSLPDFLERSYTLFSPGKPYTQMYSLSEAARRLRNPITPKPLANPIPWAICADHYVACAKRRPDLFRRFDPSLSKLRKILSTGRDLEKGLHHVLENSAPAVSGYPFFHSLLEAYRDRLEALRSNLALERATTVTTQLRGYDFLAGSKQKPLNDWPVPGGKIPFCLESPIQGTFVPPPLSETMPVPTSFESLLPNEFRVANDLQLGSLEICVDQLAFAGHVYFGIPSGKTTETDPRVRIRVRYAGQVLFSRQYEHYRILDWDENFRKIRAGWKPVGWYDGIPETFVTYAQDIRWSAADATGPDRRPTPAELAQTKASNAAIEEKRKQVAKDIETKLTSVRQELEKRLHENLGQPQTPLWHFVHQAAGARELFLAFLQVSLPKTLADDKTLQQLVSDPKQSLLDESGMLAILSSQPFFPDDFRPDQPSGAFKVASQRIDAIDGYLQRAFQKGVALQSDPLLEHTVAELELLQAQAVAGGLR